MFGLDGSSQINAVEGESEPLHRVSVRVRSDGSLMALVVRTT